MPTEQVKQSEQAKQEAKQEEYKPKDTSTLNPARKLRVKVIKMQKPGWNDWWELRVAKTQKEMMQDIRAYDKSIGKEEEFFDDLLGRVSPIFGFSSIENPKFAVMFLNEQNLTVDVISHECLHLAMAHERIIHFSMWYGDGFESLEDEERMGHYMTSCIRGIYATLIAQKVIDPKKEFKLV